MAVVQPVEGARIASCAMRSATIVIPNGRVPSRARVDGLLRDKSRPPGRTPLAKAVVERVVELILGELRIDTPPKSAPLARIRFWTETPAFLRLLPPRP